MKETEPLNIGSSAMCNNAFVVAEKQAQRFDLANKKMTTGRQW